MTIEIGVELAGAIKVVAGSSSVAIIGFAFFKYGATCIWGLFTNE
tara:strand:+ start:449 stop:583 length:135 start_codon:yes stop_codon:yes gene_type:complete